MSLSTCLPELFALTLALVALTRFGARRPPLEGLKRRLLPVARPLGWGAAGLLTVAAVAWPDVNRYEAYQTFLFDVPLRVQAFVGLVLAIVPGWIVAHGWLAKPRPRAAHLALAAACVGWTVLHARLPIHLSAPDFDDFFVVDKFTHAVQRGWFNDKPFFTIWDYPLRWMEDAAAFDPLARFKINGWFALVYVLLVGLLLERGLPELLGPRWPRTSAWLPWLAAIHLGPLVLSHGIPYELACATWILALCLALEWMRTGPLAPPWFLPLVAIAAARFLQGNGHGATAMAWAPVYVHGVIVMRRWRAPTWAQVWSVALPASAAIDILLRQHLGNTINKLPSRKLEEVGPWGLLPLALALAALWWVQRPRGGTLWGFVVLAWRKPTLAHVWLAYLLTGAAIYFFANHETFGLAIPGARSLAWNLPWDFGVNHARYALFMYPPLVVLVAGLLAPRGPLGLLAIALCAVGWNVSYVVIFYGGSTGPQMSAVADRRSCLFPPAMQDFFASFYGDPTGIRLPTIGYRRNSRFLEGMQRLLPRLEGEPVVAFLPIPRDHGDNYLVRAASPHQAVVAACAPWARERPDLPLVVSDHTLDVLMEDNAPPALLDTQAAYRGDVFVLRMGDLSAAALDKWCVRSGVSDWGKAPPEEERL